jgi:hypothetical protein
MFTANIVPGYGFQEVEIYIKRHGKTASGRVTTEGYQPAEQAFLGIVAEASQHEKEEWRQNQHPITHTIWSNGKSKGYRLSCVPRRT